jgi:dihydrofolate synthase/folylpolyglutamate synthase
MFPGTLVALTSIDLEHTDLLGKTKEQIAYDKIDLCPDHGTVVSVNRDAELWARMAAYCRLRRICLVDANSVWTVQRLDDDLRVTVRGMKVRLTRNAMAADVTIPLLGLFQLDNAAVACTIAELWAQQFLAEMSPQRIFSAVCDGLSHVNWPGRFQNISSAPPVYIDVGHSPDACRRFAESVGTFLKGAPILLVTGVSHNKAVEDILSILVPIATCVVCTRAYHMGEKTERISEVVHTIAPQIEQHTATTIEEAVLLARELANRRGLTVIVAGGLFLSIEFLTAWRGSDPRHLRFY